MLTRRSKILLRLEREVLLPTCQIATVISLALCLIIGFMAFSLRADETLILPISFWIVWFGALAVITGGAYLAIAMLVTWPEEKG